MPTNDETTTYEVVEYYTNRPKCARCAYLNCFVCEHKTPVRDALVTQYYDEGKFYIGAKPQIKKSHTLNIRKSIEAEINFLEKNNQCARCKQLNTFGCEHSTDIRDSILEKYNEEGRFYMAPTPRLGNRTQAGLNKSKNLSKSFESIKSVDEIDNYLIETSKISFIDDKSKQWGEEKLSNKVSDLKQEKLKSETKKQSIEAKQTPPKPVAKTKIDETNKSGGCCSVM